MIYQLTVALVLFLQIGAQAAPAKPSIKDYWEKTSINFDNLKIWVNNAKCAENVKAYEACFVALNSMASNLTDVSILLPPNYYSSHQADFVKVVDTNGALILVVPKPIDPKTITYEEFIKQYKAKTLAISLEVQKNFSLKQINFDYWFTKLRANPKYFSKPQLYAAEAFNAYLGVAYDPHTRFMTSEMIKDMLNEPNEKFFGIGVAISGNELGLKIEKVLKNSPALAAGLLKGDIVISVDGVNLKGMEVDTAVDKIKGPDNSKIVLTILREAKTLIISVIRGPVETKNVESEMVSILGKNQAYVKLSSFMDKRACESVAMAVHGLEMQGAKGIILDLRGDPGGLLDQAVCITGLFVGRGKIAVSVKDLKGPGKENYFTEFDKITDLPMVTLIDAGSASASEIVAGALQDYGRSWIIGQRSFGKGSVQEGKPVSFEKDRILMEGYVRTEITAFVTTQRFYQPSGTTNQLVGIIPDITIPLVKGSNEFEKHARREEDKYNNALPAMNLTPKPRRPGEIAALEYCMAQKPAPTGVDVEDYQLFYAKEALTCSNR